MESLSFSTRGPRLTIVPAIYSYTYMCAQIRDGSCESCEGKEQEVGI